MKNSILANVQTYFNSVASKGPVMVSSGYDTQLKALVDVAEFEVPNKSTVPNDLPFGILADIVNKGNINKAYMRVRFGPGFLVDELSWPTTAVTIKDPSRMMRKATMLSRVVPIGFDIAGLSAPVWDASVVEIDDRHGMLTYLVPVTYFPLLYGSEMHPDFDSSSTFTEEIVPAGTTSGGVANVEVDPINDLISRRITHNPPANLLTLVESFPVTINLRLPKVLLSLDLLWNESTGSGVQEGSWAGTSVGSSYSLSASLSDQAGSSGSVIPIVVPKFSNVDGASLPGTAYGFYMMLPITEAGILARLATITGAAVARWPVFKTKDYTIVGAGQSVSITASASVSAHSSGTTGDDPTNTRHAGQTSGADISCGVSNQVIQTGPCIHDNITITAPTKSFTVSASAALAAAGDNFPSVSSSKSLSKTATSFVTPSYFPATSPSSLPSSGLYIATSDISPTKRWGAAFVYVELLNASVLA